MKDLHLLRHAKSSWDDPTLPDRDRPLNQRGRRDAPRMGAALRELMEPLPVASSPALRARLTLQGLCSAWPEVADLAHRSEEALYTFSAADLRYWLCDQPDELSARFVIGHNPGLTELVNWLAGADVLSNLPTAGYAHLSLDIERWRDLRRGCGRLERRLSPKQL
jgi:phosphohistidine phosphatase